ncbi:MAG TPA: aspartate 1-decarboxylase [Longimicrobiales bacterium]
MKRTMCKSKIHRATVTDANLNYEGSITIDGALLDAADILEYEQVHVVNIANGARFETYAIRAPENRGDVVINGAAARLVQPGDAVIIFSYGSYDEEELEEFAPTFVFVDAENRIAPRATRRTA